MMVIDFQNQEIWLLKTKSWKLTRLNSFHRYLRIQKNSINTFFLTFFCTKWYKLNCEKRKARFSCSFWQINMVWAAKTSQTREVEGAATHFFHVHVSGAIKKGKTFILTIKCGGGGGKSLTWLLGSKKEGCLWFTQKATPPPPLQDIKRKNITNRLRLWTVAAETGATDRQTSGRGKQPWKINQNKNSHYNIQILINLLLFQPCPWITVDFLTCRVSMASILLSKPSRSELTSLRSSLSLFRITCTFSWASRQSLPWARTCSEGCDCSSRVWGLALTSSWADSSWRDDTFCCESSSSRLICCTKIKDNKLNIFVLLNVFHLFMQWHVFVVFFSLLQK